ncbi:MAG: hypothetical protein U0Q03_23155 [Acidimicrobiales bacterium]
MTNDVLEAAGRSKRSRELDVATGRLRPLRRGVAAVGGAPPTWRQAVRAVLLAAGTDIAASHATAIRLWLGVRLDDRTIHVTGRLGRQIVMDGVVGHRSGQLLDGDVVVLDGMPVTSPLRTIVDLSGGVPFVRLGKLFDEFLRLEQIDLEVARLRVAELRPAPGRSVRALRGLLGARIPGYDPGDSPLEARIVRVIDRCGLPRATQQYEVQFDGVRYRLDFAWPDRRVFLEGNGFGFHRLAADLDRDARRQNELVIDGWRPIEVTFRMTDAEIERVLRAVLT